MDPSKLRGNEPGTPSATPRPELIGRILSDRYRVDALVATGAFGAVYRGVHLHMRKQVAIKVLHPEVEHFPELVERFEREAVAGAHISHPNVAVASDLGKFDGESYFLVQEYVPGQTLREAIDQGRLPAVRAAFIARQIAAGLAAAHRHRIVHRDIKPRNVMLVEGSDDFVKLIDFGFARVPLQGLPHLPPEVEGQEWLASEAGVVFGSVAYMAPEAALGMRNIDERSDLYALGVILYEMLTGKHPFDVTLPSAELFQQHREAPPPPLQERNPEADAPPELEAIVLRLLEKEPERRPNSAAAAMAAIDSAMRGVPGYPDRGRSDLLRVPRRAELLGEPDADARRGSGEAGSSNLVAVAAVPKRGRAVGFVVAAVALGCVALLGVRYSARSDRARGTEQVTETVGLAPSAPNVAGAAASASRAAFDVRYEQKLRDQLVSFPTHGSSKEGATVLLALLQLNPRGLEDEPIQVATASLVSRLPPKDDSTSSVFYALSYRAGGSGLDVLHRVFEAAPASYAGHRAESILSLQATSERASPALRITWEIRKTRCAQKPLLFERAGEEGDARTARQLSKLSAPGCKPRRGECCIRGDARLERALARIEERFRQ
jgi:eukaryotic-like serine/threonine-protein kinase